MTQLIKEACVETLEQAISAESQGADRIELCTALDKDGLTPSLSLIQNVKNIIRIPIKVMVRPRPGDFVYSKQEISQMESAIRLCKSLNVEGVVFGILNSDNTIDEYSTQMLANYANPLNVTFHKAIDLTPNVVDSVQLLSKIKNVKSILTSGGKATAQEGIDHLNKMIEASKEQLKIVAAGKVTNENIAQLSQLIKTNEFHGKRIVGDLN